VAGPAETADLLFASPFYAAERPVALYTWTDVMATAGSREHLASLLSELASRGTPNPVVLITKWQMPDDTIEAASAAMGSGVRVVVYLSCSGLDKHIERAIQHDDIRANFPRSPEPPVSPLLAASIPGVRSADRDGRSPQRRP
jgi:hypothetical protein